MLVFVICHSDSFIHVDGSSIIYHQFNKDFCVSFSALTYWLDIGC